MAKTPANRRARLAALTRHIPAFSDPAVPVGEWFEPESAPGTLSPAAFTLNADAERFVADCYAQGWVLPNFDWAMWARTDEAQTLRDDPKALACTTKHQLAQLLTVVIRQDHFVEGALEAVFASGLILSILRRAQQLAGGAVMATGGSV